MKAEPLSTSNSVTVGDHEDCAVITLNRPAAMNTITVDLLTRLEVILDDLPKRGCRAVIITGAGDRAFCGGADLSQIRDQSVRYHAENHAFGRRVFQKLEDLPLVSIAAINGYALGGGLELAMACTLRVAVSSARLGCPEIALALVPGYGGTYRLPRLIGLGAAQDLILTGRTIDAAEAHSFGLVNRVVDVDVLDAAFVLASQITKHSLPALDLAKRAVLGSSELQMRLVSELEPQAGALAYALEDSREGISAFLEKRAPRFSDR
jgi:enoyl-CoA hydratase